MRVLIAASGSYGECVGVPRTGETPRDFHHRNGGHVGDELLRGVGRSLPPHGNRGNPPHPLPGAAPARVSWKRAPFLIPSVLARAPSGRRNRASRRHRNLEPGASSGDSTAPPAARLRPVRQRSSPRGARRRPLIPSKRYRARAVAEALEDLTTSSSIREACAAIRRKIEDGGDAISATCDVVLKLTNS